MKLRKIGTEEYIDLPDDGTYLLRSSERIDLRPGEKRDVDTGLEMLANKEDGVSVIGHEFGYKDIDIYGRSYQELKVPLYNSTLHTIYIFPGDLVGEIVYEPDFKTVSFETEANFVEEETTADNNETE